MAKDVEQPPEIVAGKYRIQRLIGRGGMGAVWEAEHVTLGTHVAIKFIDSAWADSSEARSRFDNEARAAARIRSKHAIQIHDHGVTEDGRPYIVMEHLTGEPLDKRLDRLGRLTLNDTARIVGQVSRALTRAHERGIIHRDLKPENIFLVRGPDDDEDIAKVLDFGIAKFKASDPSRMSSGTKTGSVLGTPFYMAPEQARALKTIDHRADVWSLGVLTYRCVVGELPFDGESVADLLVKICTAPVPLPSSRLPGLPASFDVWFQRALEREPEKRFSSVAELAEHLNAVIGLGPNAIAPSVLGGEVQCGAPSGQPNTPQTPSAPPGSPNVGGNLPTPAPSPAWMPAQTTPFAPAYRPARTEPAPALAATHMPVTSSNSIPAAGLNRWSVFTIIGLAAVGVGAVIVFVAMQFTKDSRGAAGAGSAIVSPTSTGPSVPTTESQTSHHDELPPLVTASARPTAAVQVPIAKPAATVAIAPTTATPITAPTQKPNVPTVAPPKPIIPIIVLPVPPPRPVPDKIPNPY